MRSERGATIVEYALGLAVFILVIVTAVHYLENSAQGALNRAAQNINTPAMPAVTVTTTTEASDGPGIVYYQPQPCHGSDCGHNIGDDPHCMNGVGDLIDCNSDNDGTPAFGK